MIICFQARAEDKLIRQSGAEEDSETKFHPPKREREKSVPKDNRGENLFSVPIYRRKTRVCSSAISDKKKNFGRVRLKGILVPRRKRRRRAGVALWRTGDGLPAKINLASKFSAKP